MDINTYGGYEYAIQRLSDGRYFSREYGWAADPDLASSEPALTDEYGFNAVLLADAAGAARLDVAYDVIEEAVQKEADAYEFCTRFLKPGYRIVRIPWLTDHLLGEDENGREYEEGECPYFDEDGNYDYGLIRDKVFGPGAAVAAPEEDVPDDAPWSPCSREELNRRIFALPEATAADSAQSAAEFDRIVRDVFGVSAVDLDFGDDVGGGEDDGGDGGDAE